MTLDHTKPCRTTDGTPADFVCDDKHRLYPLSFTVAGRTLSYTREGRYELSGAHPLDLYNEGHEPLVAQLRLAL